MTEYSHDMIVASYCKQIIAIYLHIAHEGEQVWTTKGW